MRVEHIQLLLIGMAIVLIDVALMISFDWNIVAILIILAINLVAATGIIEFLDRNKSE